MRLRFSWIAVIVAFVLSACAGPQYSRREYAVNKTARSFEYDMKDVWGALEKVVEKKKVLERDPKQVTPSEWSGLRERALELDWAYSQSRDKYKTYTVNSIPKQQPLQVRVKHSFLVKRALGGAEVEVRTLEEVEELDDYGVSTGYAAVGEIDSSRPAELLEQIGQALLSASARPLGQ